jgi:PKD repeat protein
MKLNLYIGMKKRLLPVLFLTFSAVLFSALNAFADDGKNAIRFIQNKGQWDSKILYKGSIPDGDLFFEKNCLTFNFWDGKAVQRVHANKSDGLPPKKEIDFHAFKLKFSGANPNPMVTSLAQTSEYYNYYIGNKKDKWASHVNAFQDIRYTGIYNGIDLSVKSNGMSVKYEFTVAPNANADQIVLDFEGTSGLQLKDGNLIINTSINDIIEQKPVAFQMIDGVAVPVECAFALSGTKVYYTFPNGYDKRYELVVDPNLIFCSYSGSVIDNWGFTATYDQFGNLYAGGITFANGYPLSVGAFQQTFGGGSCDATISKYTANGSVFLYSTYLGGDEADQPHSMIVNGNNELYVYGSTGSDNFPTTTGAYDATYNGGTTISFESGFIDFNIGSDIYIARFKDDGTDLLSSTYYGGSANDGLNINSNLQYNYADQSRGEIYIDQLNNVYIGSSTLSTNLPVTIGAMQPANGGSQDGCIAKFDNNLSTLQWASYLGGSNADAIYSLIVDKSYNVYATGGTTSQNFPVTNGALHTAYLGGIADAFVSKISANGQQLLRSTYYGTDQYDQAYFVQLDKQGDVYFVGQTEGTGTSLIVNAAFNNPGGNQFIAKLAPDLDNIVWSTAFGKAAGKPDIVPSAFLVDVCSKVYVSGWGGDLFGQNINNATATGLPLSNDAFQSSTDGSDYYLIIIDDNASSLIYATYFGGASAEEHVDGGTSRFDRQGIIYQSICAGCGGLSDMPTTPGVVSQTNNSTNCNNGVFKFDFDFPMTVADFAYPQTGCAPYDITFNNLSTGGVTYVWDFGDGSGTSNAVNPQHTYDDPGTYTVTLIAQNPANCNIADTTSQIIFILDQTASTLPDTSTCPGVPVQIGIPPLSDPNVTYTWSPASGVNNASASSPLAIVSSQTTFTLLVTNGTCVDTFYQTVNISGSLNINAGPDITLCQGQPGQIGFVDNTGNFTYLWSPSTGLSDPTISNPIADPTQTTTYILTVTSNDTTGCGSDIDTVTVFISNVPPTASFEYLFAPTCDKLGLVLDNTSGGTGPFYWNFGNGYVPATGDTSILVDYSSSYTISLVVGNAPCSDTVTVTITAQGLGGYLQLNDVNVITPLNGDNLNSCFSPILPMGYNLAPESFPLLACSELTIYNRWGRKIWEGNGCWNGYTQGGSEVTEGVYYYIFKIGDLDKHGTITVAKGK